MELCSIMGLGIRHDGSHWWQLTVAIEGGLIWWTDWLDGCLKGLRWTLSDKFRLVSVLFGVFVPLRSCLNRPVSQGRIRDSHSSFFDHYCFHDPTNQKDLC